MAGSSFSYKIFIDGREVRKGVMSEPSTVMQLLLREGIVLSAPCGGRGRCGKCAVRTEGKFGPVSENELELLGAEKAAAGYRLACAAVPEGGFAVHVPSAGVASVSIEGGTEAYSADPPVKSLRTVRDGRPVWRVSRDGEVLFESPERPRIYGLAVDIGTTTVAAYLLDLESGRQAGALGELNAQRGFGADVISRISAAGAGNLQRLRSAVTDQINGMSARLCESAGADPNDIMAVSVCGNPTMEHLFAGYDPAGIARAPFTPASLFGEDLPDLNGVRANPAARVFVLPSISAYIGGDITADVLACGMHRRESPCLLLDIGTNGEMALGCGGRIFYCSTAAGPAFEGAHIEDGVGGVEGAVSSVWLEKDGAVGFSTIGGKPPVGICGSGIIDAAAVMLKIGAFDETGRMCSPDELPAAYRSRFDAGKQKFMICPESGIGITGRDVRQIQLAKAAIAAGIDTLLRRARFGGEPADPEKISEVFIAGGFGAHINTASACEIGLIPKAFLGRIKAAGNSAGAGAVRTLLDRGAREQLREISRTAEYIELSSDQYFSERYIENMCF